VRIAFFGTTGTVGSRIFAEAIDRGHEVTAVMRDPTRAPAGVAGTSQADVTDASAVARAVEGHDAVISAVSGIKDGQPRRVVDAAHTLIEGLQAAGVKRLLIVGGAGSLEIEGGGRLVDSPDFPEAWKGGSLAQADSLAVYQSDGYQLDWTYLSPADLLEPGERTGRYVTGTDRLLRNADGVSRISAEDYAVAMIDELERPAHVRRRFTARGN
jgi:putative NADH-flavin reductase